LVVVCSLGTVVCRLAGGGRRSGVWVLVRALLMLATMTLVWLARPVPWPGRGERREARLTDEPVVRDPARHDAAPPSADSRLGRVRSALGVLFPRAASSEAQQQPHEATPGWRRVLDVIVQLAAVCTAMVVLLLRIPRIPAWDTVYAEDRGEFLLGALAHPWRLLVPYGGYEELMPRLVGQLVSYLPLPDADVGFALAGSCVAALCALFLFHALDGWIGSPWLRVLAAAALILLPMAPIEIADNNVNSPWYTLAVLPVALLWRPRGWPGMTAAALIAFAAASAEILAVLCAPLVLLRLVALPRWREHAVTAGWLAGLAVQVPVVLESYAQHTQRLAGLGSPGYAVAY
jgi:hypothetical protein